MNADVPLAAGQVLAGRYEIEHVVGRGGVGVVHAAHDRDSGAEVVVKVLDRRWSEDREAVARFEREAARLQALRHPNIVRMHDFGHHDGRGFLVMEYVRGQSLSSLLRCGGWLSQEDFVPLARQMLEAVGHAHSREIMLRDIKPANIMVCERSGQANHVVLLDFGLAKRLHDDVLITRGNVLGTVGYVAPETLRGERDGLSVDVYALGVSFWRMLTGSSPYSVRDPTGILHETVHGSVPSLRDALCSRQELPAELISLVEQCLERSPSRRPSDANDVLQRLIDCVPVHMLRAGQRLEPLAAGGDDASETAMEREDTVVVETMVAIEITESTRPFHRRRGSWALRGALALAAACAAGPLLLDMALDLGADQRWAIEVSASPPAPRVWASKGASEATSEASPIADVVDVVDDPGHTERAAPSEGPGSAAASDPVAHIASEARGSSPPVPTRRRVFLRPRKSARDRSALMAAD